MPVFNLTVPIAVKAILKRYPPATLRPGDVLITNDPWLCAGHLFDIAVVTPVFRDGVLVALTATVGHVGDIGGTKDSLRAREIYDEGFQIPPMFLYRAGVPNEDLLTLLAENVRKPEEVLGDVHSFVAANQLGADRLLQFMDDYGMHDLRALAPVVQDRAEGRCATRSAPCRTGCTGRRSATTRSAPGCATRWRSRSRATRSSWTSTGAPPQHGAGRAELHLVLRRGACDLSAEVHPQPGRPRSNAGCYRPFTVELPPGSILNADKPAAVNLRTRTGWYMAPNIFRALSAAAPGQVQAMTGLPQVDRHLRPRRGRHHLHRPFLLRRRPGRQRRVGREVRAAVSHVRRQHLDRAGGKPRAGAGGGEEPGDRLRQAPAGTAAAWAPASACASCATTACRCWSASIPRASGVRTRACSAANPAARPGASCTTSRARRSTIAARASW